MQFALIAFSAIYQPPPSLLLLAEGWATARLHARISDVDVLKRVNNAQFIVMQMIMTAETLWPFHSAQNTLFEANANEQTPKETLAKLDLASELLKHHHRQKMAVIVRRTEFINGNCSV